MNKHQEQLVFKALWAILMRLMEPDIANLGSIRTHHEAIINQLVDELHLQENNHEEKTETK